MALKREKYFKIDKVIEVRKKVKLIGFKKNPYDYLMKADLYINSSYFEGFPNSVVEAAHIGLPIIASQSHGGINEILSGGKGGTIYTDIQNLKKLIEKFIDHPKIFLKNLELRKKNHYNLP